jgi:HlyD family secretion protein
MLKKITIIISAIIILSLLIIFSGFFFSDKDDNNVDESLDRIYIVKKGDLIMGIELTGTVNAKKQHNLASEVSFPTKLVSVVDENSKVKKGEVLAEFETENLIERIDDLALTLDNEKKEFLIRKEEREILISSNKAEIEKAENQVVESQATFNKYWKLEGPKAKDLQANKVDTAEREMEEAETTYHEFRDKISQTVYSDASEETTAKSNLANLKQTMNNKKTTYNNSLLDQKILKRYTHPNKITTLRNRLDEVQLNLKRAKIQTVSLMVQKENQIHHMEVKIKKLERDLTKLRGFLPKMKLVAPVDGLVVYGEEGRRRWSRTEIKVGMDIRRGQVLITIPDLSELIVNFDIPEQYRTKVKIEDNSVITPESLPTLKMNGKVYHIDTRPVNQIRWDPSSPKIYHASLDLLGKNEKIVSGMNVRVAIVNQVLKERILVPIEAVFEKNGQYFVYLKSNNSYEELDVTVGEANDNFVEIKEGLNENDQVYLYRPYQSSNGGENN